MHILEQLAISSLRASKFGISGVVTLALFWLLVHIMIWRMMKGAYAPEIYVSTGFCILSYISLVIAAMIGITTLGIIVASLVCVFVIFTLSNYLIQPSTKSSMVIAFLTPIFAYIASYTGNQVEALILQNALK